MNSTILITCRMIIITEPIEDPQHFALYEDLQDVSSNQGDSSIRIDHIYR